MYHYYYSNYWHATWNKRLGVYNNHAGIRVYRQHRSTYTTLSLFTNLVNFLDLYKMKCTKLTSLFTNTSFSVLLCFLLVNITLFSKQYKKSVWKTRTTHVVCLKCDIWTNKQTEGQTDRQMERQTTEKWSLCVSLLI